MRQFGFRNPAVSEHRSPALKEIETELHAFFEVLSSFDFSCQQGELVLAQTRYDTAPLISRDLHQADLDVVRDPQVFIAIQDRLSSNENG